MLQPPIGLGSPYEPPEAPDLRPAAGAESAERCVERLLVSRNDGTG
ncbi:MAG: hypothetical protein OXI65_09435 [Acidobacteriota bacterium]|nr:hypothetical protein [Acidobacteriota bacterium]